LPAVVPHLGTVCWYSQCVTSTRPARRRCGHTAVSGRVTWRKKMRKTRRVARKCALRTAAPTPNFPTSLSSRRIQTKSTTRKGELFAKHCNFRTSFEFGLLLRCLWSCVGCVFGRVGSTLRLLWLQRSCAAVRAPVVQREGTAVEVEVEGRQRPCGGPLPSPSTRSWVSDTGTVERTDVAFCLVLKTLATEHPLSRLAKMSASLRSAAPRGRTTLRVHHACPVRYLPTCRCDRANAHHHRERNTQTELVCHLTGSAPRMN